MTLFMLVLYEDGLKNDETPSKICQPWRIKPEAEVFLCIPISLKSYSIFSKVSRIPLNQDQDQDSLLVKRRNDNHSPRPMIRELVPSSHQRSELSNTILCIFSRSKGSVSLSADIAYMCFPSQITCNCYSKVFNAFNVFKVSFLQGI